MSGSNFCTERGSNALSLITANTHRPISALRQVGGAHEALWFGTGCLFRNASRCYPAGHEYYDVTNFGLNRLLNQVGGVAVCCWARPQGTCCSAQRQHAWGGGGDWCLICQVRCHDT